MAEPAESTGQFRPYRPVAADGGALLRWPASFGTRFAVMVDTEEEFDWTSPISRDRWTVSSVGALSAAHNRFVEAGVPIVYLVDHPIADDPRAVDAIGQMLGDGRSSVGTQLHPWVSPPLDELVNGHNSFTGNLPLELQAAKLDILTALITSKFGSAPRIYRAGRYGLGRETAAMLVERGYRIDSSMRSRYDYSAEGGPDYSHIANHAFRTGPDRRLVELPLTTVFVGPLGGRGRRLQQSLVGISVIRGALARAGLLSRIALTPEDMPVAAVLEAIRVAKERGVRLLNFSFHSPTVEPGHTPYVRDAADLVMFWAWWDAVLNELDRLGIKPAGEADLIAAIDAAR